MDNNILPPKGTFETSFYITLPKMNIEFRKFKSFCKHFGCVVRVVKGEWQIESEDPINFYWLGANMVFRHRDALSESIASKILD